MENNSSYRIHTNIGQDSVVRVQLTQGIDTLEILSLKLTQEETYRLHTSNYGVVVGRVLANDAFGIPNAKVSIFIPIDDDDRGKFDITNLYNFSNVRDVNEKNLPYNLLPSTDKDVCHQAVGSFPDKLTVLDNDIQIEVFEKYYKYTTVTNQCGDYMIFGVPCGSQTVHVDVDLSDIGVLSQKPRDMIYQGYDIAKFENSNQFKSSTNLDDLPQIKRQDAAVQVYPFWGDENEDEIAITRQDLKIPYDFKPTCVFMGCIVSDDYSNAIGHNCKSSIKAGYNSNLISNLGSIEMIRKTPDGVIEEYPIPQTDQIDGDGVWCFQIPMNLDYVGMDEYGNIVPTDDPSKGIPTRASVRFRFSVQETQNEGVSRHRAKHLVPSIVPLKSGSNVEPSDNNVAENWYSFGSSTKDEYFRDLFWNKVYSVKSYIPRVQKHKSKSERNYSALRTANVSEGNNPLPFNTIRIRLGFVYMFICLLLTVVTYIITAINSLFSGLYNAFNAIAKICIKLPLIGNICPFNPLVKPLMAVIPKCIKFNFSLDNQSDGTCYVPGCCGASGKRSCQRPECNAENLIDNVQSALAQEFDIANLDLSNDWINGTLYFPLWFWKKTKKQKFLFGLISRRAKNEFCDCSKDYNDLYIARPCSIPQASRNKKGNYHREIDYKGLKHGVIKEYTRQDGLNVYYYSPLEINGKSSTLLYATDLILLGSFNDCDMDGLPKFYTKLPSTTSNVPFMSPIITTNSNEDVSEDALVDGTVEFSGMDATRTWDKDVPKSKKGLFFDLSCTDAQTFEKSCFNVGRMSELGVSMDGTFQEVYSTGSALAKKQVYADGLITKYELVDVESRSMFASLNHNGLRSMRKNKMTNYSAYDLKYIYTTNFDGAMANYAQVVTQEMDIKTTDIKDDAYEWFRYGMFSDDWNVDSSKKHYGSNSSFLVTHNSFYFYFGLKDGSTAIDKFNAKYGASCQKKKRQNIVYSISTTPSEWCIDEGGTTLKELGLGDDSEYGSIAIEFDKITMPYSYVLSKVDNTVLYSSNNETHTSITWRGNGYVESGDDSGSEDDVRLVMEITGVPIVNQTYKLQVTDANGYTIQETIQLDGIGLSANVNASPLGDKFYEGISSPMDFCGDISGKIAVSNILVDGQEYDIDQNSILSITNGQYRFVVTKGNNKKSTIELTIRPLYGSEKNNFESYCCNGTYSYKDGSIVWDINQPMEFEVQIKQVCDTSTIENIYITSVKVENGQVFNTYINNVPTSFLKNTLTAATDSNFDKCFAPHLVSSYGFYDGFNTSYGVTIWSDYLSITTEENSNNWDDDSKYAIAEYALKSIGQLCSSLYVTESSNALLSLSSSGGQKPILFNSISPLYASVNDDTCQTQPITSRSISTSGYIVVPNEGANVVGDNYLVPVERNANGVMLRKNASLSMTGPQIRWNEIYNVGSYRSNFFAAFSNNGGYIKSKDEDGVKCRKGMSYVSKPSSASPRMTPCNAEVGNNNLLMNYLQAATIDRRLDYVLFVKAPFDTQLSNFKVAKGDDGDQEGQAWKKGLVYGTIINGIPMGYDNHYNIVYDENNPLTSDINKYEYVVKDGKLEYNTNCTNKKLYNASIDYASGSKSFETLLTHEEFVKDKYPTHALVQIKDVPNTDSISINLTNCSYAFEPRINYQDYNINDNATQDTLKHQYLECIISEGDSCSVSLDFKNPIKPNLGNCYIKYVKVGHGPKIRKNGGMADYSAFLKFGADIVKGEVTLNADSKNGTHLVMNLAPVIVRASSAFRSKNEDSCENLLKKIHRELEKGNFDYMATDVFKPCEYFFKPNGDDVSARMFYSKKGKYFYGEDIFYVGKMDENLFEKWDKNLFNGNNGKKYPKHPPLHYTQFGYDSCPTCKDWRKRNGTWYVVDSERNILSDSDDKSTKLKWEISEFNPKDLNCDVYAIMSQKLYLNDENDHLTKEILAINFSTIIDCRQLLVLPCGFYKTSVMIEAVANEDGTTTEESLVDIEYFVIAVTVPMDITTDAASLNSDINTDIESEYVYGEAQYSDYSYNMQLLGDPSSPSFEAQGYVAQSTNSIKDILKGLIGGEPLDNVSVSDTHPMGNANWQNKDVIGGISSYTNIVYVSFSLPQGVGCAKGCSNLEYVSGDNGLVDNYYKKIGGSGPRTCIRLELSNYNGFPARLSFDVSPIQQNNTTTPGFNID